MLLLQRSAGAEKPKQQKAEKQKQTSSVGAKS